MSLDEGFGRITVRLSSVSFFLHLGWSLERLKPYSGSAIHDGVLMPRLKDSLFVSFHVVISPALTMLSGSVCHLRLVPLAQTAIASISDSTD
jgi:hypothetical protein